LRIEDLARLSEMSSRRTTHRDKHIRQNIVRLGNSGITDRMNEPGTAPGESA
jgi:hypothetical protein